MKNFEDYDDFEEEDSAIGMAKNKKLHGKIQNKISQYISNKIDNEYKGIYEGITEAVLEDHNPHSKAPDYYVQRVKDEKIILIIEITDRWSREQNKAYKYRQDDQYKGELFTFNLVGTKKHPKGWYKADRYGTLTLGSESDLFGDLKEITNQLKEISTEAPKNTK